MERGRKRERELERVCVGEVFQSLGPIVSDSASQCFRVSVSNSVNMLPLQSLTEYIEARNNNNGWKLTATTTTTANQTCIVLLGFTSGFSPFRFVKPVWGRDTDPDPKGILFGELIPLSVAKRDKALRVRDGDLDSKFW